MKKSAFLIIAILLSVGLFGQDIESCNIYLIRHAEKMKDAGNDPLLTKTGEERSIHWASVFKNIEFDAVYSTNTLRTVATALPTASQKNLQVHIYQTDTLDIVALAKLYLGKDILIVGHSNTIPNLVNELIKEEKYSDIESSNNSNLYIVDYRETKSEVRILYIEN